MEAQRRRELSQELTSLDSRRRVRRMKTTLRSERLQNQTTRKKSNSKAILGIGVVRKPAVNARNGERINRANAKD